MTHELDAVRHLVDEVKTLKRELRNLQRSTNLGRSSIDSGALVVTDADGAVSMSIGTNDDGTTTVDYVAGPTPGTPTAAVLTPVVGALVVTWDGTLIGPDATESGAPADFQHVGVYVTQDLDPDNPEPFDLDTAELAGVITSASGGSKTVGLDYGRYEVRLVATTLSGAHSEPSTPATADVEQLIDSADLAPVLSDLDTRLEDARAQLAANDGQLAELRNRFVFSAAAPTPADATGRPEGTVWTQTKAGTTDGTTLEAGRWQLRAGVWTPMGLDPTVIPELLAYLATFQKVNVGQLVATTAVMERATVIKLFTELFAAKKITATEIQAGAIQATHIAAESITAEKIDANAINGKVITGATFQTRYAVNRGITMSTAGLSAWNSSGERTFHVDPSTGQSNVTGTFVNGSPTGVGTIIDDKLWSGWSGIHLQSFYDSPTNRQAAGVKVSTDEALAGAPRGTLDLTSGSPVGTDYASGKGRSLIRLQSDRIIMETRANSTGYLGGSIELLNGGAVNLQATNTSTNTYGARIELGATGNLWFKKDPGTDLASIRSDGRFVTNGTYANTSTATANLGIFSNGFLYRSTSRRDAKLAIEDFPTSHAGRLLDVPVRTWFDRSDSERLAAYTTALAEGEDVAEMEVPDQPRRVTGVVAEEVEAAGLPELVTYQRLDDGTQRIEGVAYDRLALLLIPIVREQRDQIAALTRRLDNIEGGSHEA